MIFVLAFIVSGCGKLSEYQDIVEDLERITQEFEQESVTGTLEVHFLDVGQGDATLIRQGEHAMLIDGGDNSEGTALQAYLQSQGIEHLDYVIGTHPDADHVGGLDVILYKFSWNQVKIGRASCRERVWTWV